MKTIRDVRIAVNDLSSHFGVPIPIVRDTQRWTSATEFSKGELRISPKDWHGLEDATLHEFTHWLLFRLYGERRHTAAFFATLSAVVAYWKGDSRRYAWHKEYRRIWKLAHDLGYTSRLWSGDKCH